MSDTRNNNDRRSGKYLPEQRGYTNKMGINFTRIYNHDNTTNTEGEDDVEISV